MDRLISYIDITSSNRKFDFQEGSETATFNLPTGRLWCYSGTVLDGYPSLYNALVAGMNAQSPLGNTYVLEPATPDGYLFPMGIRIKRASGPYQFRINATSTFPLEYLSQTSGVNTPFTGATGAIAPLFSAKGIWHSYGLLGLEGATDRRRFAQRDIRFSDQDTRRAYALQVRGGSLIRATWRYLLATSIFPERASDPSYAIPSKVSALDSHNAFQDFWDIMGRSQVVGLDPFLMVWDTGTDNLTLTDNEYDILIPASTSQLEDFESVLTLESVGGAETYRLEMDFWRVTP